MTLLKDQLTGFVPVEQSREILTATAKGSTILKLSEVMSMESDTKTFPVLTDGPGAYWVGEADRIETSDAKWIFPKMEAKKIAVIIPMTKEKLKDTTIDVFNEIITPLAESFYTAIDSAALFGTKSPFAKSIYGVAKSGENFIELGTNDSLDLDISDVMALVEDAGHDVNAFVAHKGIKNKLRKLRDANGNSLYVEGIDQRELYNQPIEYSANNAFDKSKADIIAGDFKYSYVGIRQGIEYEILKEATLQNTLHTDGKPLSLAEQDLIALRATMRVGFLPIKDDAFAVLAPKGQE